MSVDGINRQAHIWEASVLDRTPVIEAINRVNHEFSPGLLTGFTVYISRSPYVREFYIVMFFDPSHQEAGSILEIYAIYTEAGAKRRTDIIVDDLIINFDFVSVMATELQPFQNFNFPLPSREQFKEYGMNPLVQFAARPRVFLSHNEDKKPQVRQMQEQFLAKQVPTWFDETDIGYGELLISRIEDGIEESGAVVFWWSQGFLKSNWCTHEYKAFIGKIARLGESRVRIFSVVDEDVPMSELPRIVKDTKYLSVTPSTSIDYIVNELAHPIRAFLNGITSGDEEDIPGESVRNMPLNNYDEFSRLYGFPLDAYTPKSYWESKTVNDPLYIRVGFDTNDDPMFLDLTRDNHVLVVGDRQPGTVPLLRTVIFGLSIERSPGDLHQLIFDGVPAVFRDLQPLPNCLGVVTCDGDEAKRLGLWMVGEIERRVKAFSEAGVDNIRSFREKSAPGDEFTQNYVLVVDNLAYLLDRGFESTCRQITEHGSLLGIHLVAAVTYTDWKRLRETGCFDGFTGRVAVGLSAPQSSALLGIDVPADLTAPNEAYYKARRLDSRKFKAFHFE